MPTISLQLNLSKHQHGFSINPCFLWLLIFFISSDASALSAKKKCEQYANRLNNIQVAQRSGHTLKRSNRLNEQERVMREKWWQCKNSSAKFNKTRKKIANKKTNTKAEQRKKKSQKSYRAISSQAVSPFKTSQAIVFKEKYQGEKKFAWLTFYQQPEKCQHPKNLTAFVFCTEEKQQQRQAFEQTFVDAVIRDSKVN